MISASHPLLMVLIIALVLVFGVPLGIIAFNWIRRRRRRKLERSKRPISIKTASEIALETSPGECPHRVSRSRARKGSDGTMTSFCKWCDKPMKRNGPGDWEVIARPVASEV
jgi:hypothetical protein